MAHSAIEAPHPAPIHSSVPGLSLAALGVVFGDIGTSPLYTLKTVLDVTGTERPEPAAILGALSLILWTLIIVTSLKYVTIALRLDNGGEGGILALMALLRRTYAQRKSLVMIGLFGAALVYGDAAITPAISVMSALEGLNIVAPHLERYVLPATVVVLVALFAAQQQGTERIGRLLGPVMLIWFATISLLGLRGIVQHPEVLWALNPAVGLRYLFSGGGITTLLVVGGVFLCVTGAEALYADLGHFGRAPIRLAWSCLVFPALILNYAGQAAYVLAGAPVEGNIFYHLCPEPLVLPLVILATAATVIASQAVITGAFSMTRQAIQLGLLPRLQIIQTSAAGHGQIYLPGVNWLLMVVTLGLAISFGSSSNLAAAYGIAVSTTMLATTVLLSAAMREIWGWPLPAVILIAIGFATVDAGFMSANALKIAQGGWVPLLLGAFICCVMLIWQSGNDAVQKQADEMQIPIGDIVTRINSGAVPRVPGTAVFVARLTRDVPPIVVWHLRHIRSLHDSIVIVNVISELIPYVADDHRTEVREIAPQVWRVHAHFGFMEQPDLPALLQRAHHRGYPVDPSNVTYFIGRETVVSRDDGKGLPRLVERIFSFLLRNSSEAIEYFHLPRDSVVEIGRQFAI
ncbi:potassium transporter Kup [Bradyrhizobium manausense]|uniref:potassium transporter Kup n=1 Tax=Bradyrhizobium TaxID=374 RepID=UPI001BAA338F|nr:MULTISPECIES: potassium transporter Kup [Bradyrhizobium]MBR0830734.1 potassium transporter Kup [Bradyrhizobium manausense]UVO28726.1 potassium transporter Kup [Bradyrhizobium arachidis]